MNINKFVLSIVKRPSFNLLAFQGVTFLSLLLAGQLVVWELMLFFHRDYISVNTNRIVYTFLFGILILLYILILFITKCCNKTLSTLVNNNRLILLHFICFYILFNIFMLPVNYNELSKSLEQGGGFIVVMLFGCAIYSIIAFSIIPLIITFIIEQIRGIRIENLPYINNKFKLAGVIFCALFPVLFWSFITIRLLYF